MFPYDDVIMNVDGVTMGCDSFIQHILINELTIPTFVVFWFALYLVSSQYCHIYQVHNIDTMTILRFLTSAIEAIIDKKKYLNYQTIRCSRDKNTANKSA